MYVSVKRSYRLLQYMLQKLHSNFYTFLVCANILNNVGMHLTVGIIDGISYIPVLDTSIFVAAIDVVVGVLFICLTDTQCMKP